MLNAAENPPHPKRVLTKVRRRFLNKTPDPSEPQTLEYTRPRSQSIHVNVLNPCIGLVEVNGKVYLGMQSLNPYLTFGLPHIEHYPTMRAVKVNVHYLDGANRLNHEESIKKLENYKDLELDCWASRLRRYYQSYPVMMARYFNALHSGDSQALINFRRAKNRAALACREIENNCSYRKLLNFLDKDSAKLVSTTYSEGLLREMGYTPEEFVEWTTNNGLPRLFDQDIPQHLDIARDFLDCVPFEGEPVKVSNEYTARINDKFGNKIHVVGQYTYVIEPTPEGMFVSGYFILKRRVEICEERKAPAGESQIINFDFQPQRGIKQIKERSYEETEEDMT